MTYVPMRPTNLIHCWPAGNNANECTSICECYGTEWDVLSIIQLKRSGDCKL